MMDYAALSREAIASALDEVARGAEATFGGLTTIQLNWRPDMTRWSVGQCLEHLITANRLMLAAAGNAMTSRPRTMWERLPWLPALSGRMLIRSQAPGSSRRFTAPQVAQPSSSDIAPDVVERFVTQQLEVMAWVRTLDERQAKTIMTSPFVRVIAYSVLDGCRLMVAHDHRHVEQARRVMQSPAFPPASIHAK
jgi:hypothetical protein